MTALLAWQAGGAGKSLEMSELLAPVSIFLVVVVFGAIGLGKVAAYFRRTRREEGALDVLTDFRSLKQRGELSDEEYQKIRSAVSRRVKKAEPPKAPLKSEDPEEE